jgi:biopolymer transport protein ExbD
MAVAQMRDDEPLGEMNTTPLIDVMLVLLIMFIITIPPQSHSVPIDLPSGPPPQVPFDNERNKLIVTRDGALLWNGAPIDQGGLRGALARMTAMPRQPELQFEPDPEARYGLVDEVLGDIKRANVTAMGFVGNERYARF